MLYKDFLKTNTRCPFCGPLINRVIKKGDVAFLTYSLAPYHKHHLLVVPNHHVDSFQDLNNKEIISINKLLHNGVTLLKSLGYENYTILVRNGNNLGKSIEHLHYHIVPSVIIGDLDHVGQERKVMTKEEIDEFFEDLRKAKRKK